VIRSTIDSGITGSLRCRHSAGIQETPPFNFATSSDGAVVGVRCGVVHMVVTSTGLRSTGGSLSQGFRSVRSCSALLFGDRAARYGVMVWSGVDVLTNFLPVVRGAVVYPGKKDHHKRVTTERPHPTGGAPLPAGVGPPPGRTRKGEVDSGSLFRVFRWIPWLISDPSGAAIGCCWTAPASCRENSSKSTFSYRTPVQYRWKVGLEPNCSAVGKTANSLVSPRPQQLTPLPCGGPGPARPLP